MSRRSLDSILAGPAAWWVEPGYARGFAGRVAGWLDGRGGAARDRPPGPADQVLAGSETGSAPSTSSRLIRDGHQFHLPSRTTVEGTSSVRTRNVSMRMPS